jgi:hypothetical protein
MVATIIEKPGYDKESGILLDFQGIEWPPVPQNPTKDDAIAALKIIDEPLAHYRFWDVGDDLKETDITKVGRVSRSVVHSLMITTINRATPDLSPGFAISASTRGAGKNKIVELCSILACGNIPRTITQGYSSEEFEKRFIAELRVNTGLISISNCTKPIEGAFVNEFLTNKRINPRILGVSVNINVDNTHTVVWNGNNLEISGDTVRRFVRAYIAPDVEYAYLRKFPFDPVDYAREHRVRIVMAILTLLQAFTLVKKEDRPQLEPFQSFDLWSRFIRGAIVWAGGEDPVKSQKEISEADEERMALARIMKHWEKALGVNKFVAVKEIVRAASSKIGDQPGGTPVFGQRRWPGFHDEFAELDLLGKDGEVSINKLRCWLKENLNRVVDGKKIINQHNSDRNAYDWQLKQL